MSTSDTRLFVGRLAPTVQKRDLEELFGRYGTIANCSLKTTYGFVEYEDPRDARDALRELDGHRLEGSKIAVQYSHGRRSDRDGRDSRGGERGERDYRRDHRDRYYDRERDYERERDRDYDRDRDYRGGGGGGRGGGGGGKYGGGPRGRYSPPYNTEFRISVTGLPQGCSWQDLKDHFRQVGEVCFADVRRDRDGKTTGIVEFKREEDMRESVRKLDRSRLRGNTISVYCEYDGKRSRSRSRSTSRSRRRRSKRSRSRSTKRVSRSSSPRKSRSVSPKPSVSPRASRSPRPAQASPSASATGAGNGTKSRSTSPSGKYTNTETNRNGSKSPSPTKRSKSRSASRSRSPSPTSAGAVSGVPAAAAVGMPRATSPDRSNESREEQ